MILRQGWICLIFALGSVTFFPRLSSDIEAENFKGGKKLAIAVLWMYQCRFVHIGAAVPCVD